MGAAAGDAPVHRHCTHTAVQRKVLSVEKRTREICNVWAGSILSPDLGRSKISRLFSSKPKVFGKQPSKIIKFLDEKEKLKTSYAIRDMNSVSIDWREKGAVTPVQQQHPFGTCWAFSLVAATEGVMVVQGNQKLQKLSEQFVVSGVPAQNCGQGADVNWKWMVENTNGKIQVESEYPYNRTCNFFP